MILRASVNTASSCAGVTVRKKSRSPPAEKALPAPVKTTASTVVSAAISPKTVDSSRCNTSFTAFSDCGRLMVTVNTAPARVNRSVL